MIKTRTQKILLLVILTASLLACSLINEITDGSSPSPVPVPNDELGPVPSATAAEYPRAQIGFYNALYLRYDPAVWQQAPRLDGGGQPLTNQGGAAIEVLSHRQYRCELHDNLGRGIEQVTLSTYEKQIGGLTYQVHQWVSTETGNTVLVVYQYPPGENLNDAQRIELEVKDEHGKQCMQDAEAVLLLSEEEIR
jgi:hypothetical protein